MLSVLLLSVLAVQEGEPKPATAKESEVEVVPAVEDGQARDIVRDFKKAFDPRRGDLRSQLEAVETLAKGKNDKFLRPLTDAILESRHATVRNRAAEILAVQPPKPTVRLTLKLLANDKVKKHRTVVARLVRTLSANGYESRHWELLEDLFGKDYEASNVPVQIAILDLATEHKEVEAIDTLLANLDEPIPANPNSPSNPPAEYWEARWKAWQKWRENVKQALLAITGQRFSTAEEAKTWLRKNGRKIGYK